jgi:hypothetical protein
VFAYPWRYTYTRLSTTVLDPTIVNTLRTAPDTPTHPCGYHVLVCHLQVDCTRRVYLQHSYTGTSQSHSGTGLGTWRPPPPPLHSGTRRTGRLPPLALLHATRAPVEVALFRWVSPSSRATGIRSRVARCNKANTDGYGCGCGCRSAADVERRTVTRELWTRLSTKQRHSGCVFVLSLCFSMLSVWMTSNDRAICKGSVKDLWSPNRGPTAALPEGSGQTRQSFVRSAVLRRDSNRDSSEYNVASPTWSVNTALFWKQLSGLRRCCETASSIITPPPPL